MEIQFVKPHCDAMRPYGYRFSSIDLVKAESFSEALILFSEFDNNDWCSNLIQFGDSCHNAEKLIWYVASHIEGNFGPPYSAKMVFSAEHGGMLIIYTPKNDQWWNQQARSNLSNFLMGLRIAASL